ncbi:MAG: hypothetical protein DMG96_16780 [Acidobacteria bacterium]|nr:MAG: hypothetical protein DMG96_16780 [Acidobacteriota bacterium]
MKFLSSLTGLRYLAILAIASASSAKLDCSAQVAQTPTAGLQKNEAEGRATFDQTTGSLPPRFQGDDPNRIANRFSNITKSEFETTAQFEQRKRAAAPSGDLVFVIPRAAFDTKTGWEVKYDADAQKLRIIVCFYGHVQDDTQRRFNTLELVSEAYSAGEHLATNAFGAVTEVSSSVGHQYGIAVSPDHWLFEKHIMENGHKFEADNPFDLPLYRLNVSMPAEQAAALKPNLSLLFVCRLTEPRLISHLGGHEATLSAPYETVISSEYFPVEVKQVWVYDLSSGKVLQKRDATERSGARLTGSVALGNVSGSFSGKSFLIDTNDIGVGKLNARTLANISAWVSAARSKARKKREQLGAENSCRGGVSNVVSDARIWFGKSAHALSTNTVQYDGLPPASYELLVVGRIGSQVGVWSGTAVVSEDTETNIVAAQAFLCEDPNGEVTF